MNDAEIIKDFLVESYESLDRLDRELVVLEKTPDDEQTLASIFRTIHTIKGTCGFLGFSKLEAVAHAGENLLSKLRDGLIQLTPEVTTALLSMVDAVRQILTSIETSSEEGERNDKKLIATLTRLSAGKKEPEDANQSDSIPTLGELLIKNAGAKSSDVEMALEKQEAGDPRRLGEILVEEGAVKSSDIVEALQAQQAVRAQLSAAESSIRVDVGLLDRLMNLVGELVLARNQILQFSNTTEDSGIVAATQRLNLITAELQENVMKTRMQPIGNILNKFPRTVRDLALACGKQVRVEIEGEHTELDKTIIESIKDPLTHLVRNTVDHGIETPEVRRAAGKDPTGCLKLRSFHEGGQVNIEISDDGAGLDCEKVRRKAIERAIVAPEQAARMSDREIGNLIFLPGFSTTDAVTNVSGRGVGMDVVKTNLEKIGGTVDLQSRAGLGMTVRMKIPLTLAIIPALVVTSGGDRYAIPQINLLELVRLDGENAAARIELIQGAPVYRLRGRLLPLVYLNRELRVETPQRSLAESCPVNIVVLEADEREFGLVVDEINDTEEIVVKPLEKQLKSVRVFAGSTIMGDGRIALILDVLGVAQSSGVVRESRERKIADKNAQAAAASEDKQPMLLFQCGAEGRMAMQLSLVARLEEFKPEAIESAGECRVVQYRRQIMPLIQVSEALNMRTCTGADPNSDVIQVIVYSEQERSVGLVVDHIIDIVEETIVALQPSRRDGLLGSAVIQQRVTDLLDVRGLIRSAHPAFFESPSVTLEL